MLGFREEFVNKVVGAQKDIFTKKFYRTRRKKNGEKNVL